MSRTTASETSDDVLRVAAGLSRKFVNDLRTLVRFRSVSGQRDGRDGLKRCAAWLCRHLMDVGFPSAGVFPVEGAPIVWAESRTRRSALTLLVYGHYDVQPPEPLGAWRHRPFAADVDGGFVYGRGASDDKGQLMVHVSALQSYILARGAPPINVVCLFEGEEEIGSPALRRWLSQEGRRLGVDLALISDTPMRDAHTPSISTSLRGTLALDVEVRSAGHDLHSGLYGGAVRNAAEVMARMVARLHDPSGRVTVPGFYDCVAEPPLTLGSADDGATLAGAGAAISWGEAGFTAYERIVARPSLSVTGLTAGHTGDGPKAVVPATARAKLSIRLVPGQGVDDVERQTRHMLFGLVPPGTQLALRREVGADPVELRLDRRVVNAVKRASLDTFGRAPACVGSGGTIPIAAELTRMGIPTLLLGLGRPDDRVHGPDERFSISHFRRAIDPSIRLLDELAAQMPVRRAKERVA